ncbi:acetyl-CoA hydrolase/transferase family protein [Rhizosphaericola mali]|uniref:Acetyl-CoA hydrolase/transferase family protein n=1 Tax=Rhizosphaericola mali TaxID=2545455 RepID=A0A5P2GAY1_9BACT|nr:acetyl-CoA hydrolase/transferase C-terminal domain-containing protein [Rhizosphaericola mali]QES88711.1 acetyl-CoA hydrolase/transferase family protein [Rhizosphaericola mali]
MQSIQSQYEEKLTSAQQAIKLLENNDKLVIGIAVSEPPALLNELANQIKNGIYSKIKLYYNESKAPAANTILQYDFLDVLELNCLFLSGNERKLIQQGMANNRKVVNFVPTTFSQTPRILSEEIGIDTFMATVSPMDENGYFTFGTNNDYGTTVARSAKKVIIEVNENMPRVFGNSLLHISEVNAIVENNQPLTEVPPVPANDVDDKIGKIISTFIPDGATLQMGVGSLPNAICAQLVNHKDLGIHSEVITPGMINLIQQGVITNKCKNINKRKSVFTFAMGDKNLYDFINNNPAVESHPVNYVNDPSVIAQNDKVISVNATAEIDLTGACNSEYIKGHQYSSSGGQLDFVRGAYLSKGGKSFIALHSTTKDGKISKIVPKLSGPVTTPRTDTHYVVTEFGAVNLKGLSTPERALALIGIAHPSFREELIAAAKQNHLV